MNRKIAIIMGSDSDYGTMKQIIPILQENDVDYDFRVISAHRTPWIAAEFAKNAKDDGYDLFIAGAGMSAHLPGVLAAFTGLPVIGLPIKSDSSAMGGMDALHSIIQMPPGIPVAAVGIDHAEGAAKLAVKMINCYCSEPAVMVAYNKKEVSEANLDKVTKTLSLYEIKYMIADLTAEKDTYSTEKVIEALNLCENNAFAVINLTSANIEKIVQNNEHAKKIPIIEVPLKSATNNLNDTSNKVYYQTNASEATAFVGVNSYQNAAHMAARIIGIHNPVIYDEVVNEHSKLAAAVIEKDARIRSEVNEGKLK